MTSTLESPRPTIAAPRPTYGIEASDFDGDRYYYLGHDEALWAWVTAPVSAVFTGSLAEVPLPDGYVQADNANGEGIVFSIHGEYPDGVEDLTGARTSVTISVGSPLDDMIHILTRAMAVVDAGQFKAAGLAEDRVLETVSY